MAYPTTAQLVAGSTVKELTDLTTPQKEALRAEAIIAVEAYCRQSFEPEGTKGAPVTKTIDGNGSRELYLPRRLSQLVSLSVTGGVITATDVQLGDGHDLLRIPDEDTGSTWATRAIAEATCARRAVFPLGPGTVEISGVWGWADAEYPAPVTTALRQDMEDRALANQHALAETVRSARALGLGAVNQGNLSIDLKGGEPAISGRVAAILVAAELVWSGGVGALA